MSAPITYAEVDEDGQLSVLSRLTSLSGTGSELVQGEGPVVKVADVSTITCKVYDLGDERDADTGTEVPPAPTLTSVNVFDTLRTAGWKSDVIGYNFRHDVAAAYLADPAEWRLFEYEVTLTDGALICLEVRVKTRARIRS
jgi:hypothetical protein